MNVHSLFLILVLLKGSVGFADLLRVSPQRPKHISGHELTKRFEQKAKRDFGHQGLVLSLPSAVNSRKSWNEVDWKRAPEMSSDIAQKSFEFIRDQRPFRDSNMNSRRATWLYPDDGCYARAEVASNLIADQFRITPAKIFVFGDLKAQSNNHPEGVVTWWYHVAPIVKSGADYLVFDPALEPQRPLTVQEWVTRMNDKKVTISICEPTAYDPNSFCFGGVGNNQTEAERDEKTFFDKEWDRLINLGRNPVLELGDQPPWIFVMPSAPSAETKTPDAQTREEKPSTPPATETPKSGWKRWLPWTKP